MHLYYTNTTIKKKYSNTLSAQRVTVVPGALDLIRWQK